MLEQHNPTLLQTKNYAKKVQQDSNPYRSNIPNFVVQNEPIQDLKFV